MADSVESNQETLTLDADAIMDEAVAVADAAAATDIATTESGDIVSKAFTGVEGEEEEVQYVTMTPEEAAAAGVEEEEQVVTTSLQFDPANPSVLYTADGTLINQSDLSPEEQALVQAALQQHLAEQEAEQQLAMIDQSGAVENTELLAQADTLTTEASLVTSTEQPLEGTEMLMETTEAAPTTSQAVSEIISQETTTATADPVAVITPATSIQNMATLASAGVNLASPSTNASQIVQTLADNVRRQQEYLKAQTLLNRVKMSNKPDLPEGYRYEEKIVIRQGQPQVVKMPVKNTVPKRPEIPAALANLMPKIEVGKDGSQVIRIHQSQITADQLKSLQENPNVRLVFRPANSSKARPSMPSDAYPRKRGRPRKNNVKPTFKEGDEFNDSPPSKTSRYGRTSKLPYYQKDYLSPGPENGDEEVGDEALQQKSYPQMFTQHTVARRGRPPGSMNKATIDKAYRRSNSYAKKIEQLREQEFQHDEELTNARLSIVPQKPVLSSVELAISTRRKNRLRELLSACSEDEIMEVALPHLARVFSLWEFLVMKVEKNKLSRVYFADIYKEYEVLHRYVTRLTEKYKDALAAQKEEGKKVEEENGEELEKDMEKDKKNFIKVRCKKLAESLGLEQDQLEDTLINLLDSQQVTQQSSIIEKQADASDTNQGSSAANRESNADATKSVESTAASLLDAKLSQDGTTPAASADADKVEEMQVDSTNAEQSNEDAAVTSEAEQQVITDATTVDGASGGTQIIQIGSGDEKQFIEVPEGYTLIQTPEGLVMSQPGTTLSQAEDGTIYVTQEDGTTAPLDSQKGVPLETVESLLSLEGQQN